MATLIPTLGSARFDSRGGLRSAERLKASAFGQKRAIDLSRLEFFRTLRRPFLVLRKKRPVRATLITQVGSHSRSGGAPASSVANP